MSSQRQAEQYSKGLRLRGNRSARAVTGYFLLAATSVFLLNVAYQAIHTQVFDGVVAAMLGVVCGHLFVALLLIAEFGHPTPRIEDAGVSTIHRTLLPDA